jgi:hypothetical protein
MMSFVRWQLTSEYGNYISEYIDKQKQAHIVPYIYLWLFISPRLPEMHRIR